MIAAALPPANRVKRQLDLSDPQRELLHSMQSFNLFMSGAGGGKTYTMGMQSAEFLINFPAVIGLIAANTHEQLNKAVMKRISQVWRDEFKWINGIHYVIHVQPPKEWPKLHVRLVSYHNTISFNNGALLFLASLDNYKAIDGQEIGWAMLDETKDTEEQAVTETIMWRLRQPGMWVNQVGQLCDWYDPDFEGYNPLFIFTSPAKEQWLNEMFGLEQHYDEITKRIFSETDFFTYTGDGRCVVIGSSFHNKKNLQKGFIEKLIKQNKGNRHIIDTLVYGSPIAKIGGEFYHQFNRQVHVGDYPMMPGASFHLSCDQNVRPYFTLVAAQIYENEKGGWTIRFVNEFCYENPDNNMQAVCEGFAQYYGDELQSRDFGGLYYYGDVYGKIQQTISGATIKHHYQQLEFTLGRYLNDHSNRLAKKNPSVTKRRDFINNIYAGAYDHLTIEIDKKCINLIADLDFTKERADGTKDKKIVKPKGSDVGYEKYGHTGDAHDYLLVGAFEDDYNAFQI